MELENKVVAITGAYSGLGAALSKKFSGRGCRLVLAGRDAGVRSAAQLNAGQPVISVVADVRKKEDCGCIVNIASTAALDYKSNHLLYGASKCALVGLGGMKTDLFRRNPERMRNDFMDPDYAADYLINFLESGSKEWLVILRRNQ